MYLLLLMRIYWAPAVYPYWAKQCWKGKLTTLFRSHDPHSSYSILVPRWGKWVWRDEPYVQGHQQVHGRASAQTLRLMSFWGSPVFAYTLAFPPAPSMLGSMKNLLSSVEIQGQDRTPSLMQCLRGQCVWREPLCSAPQPWLHVTFQVAWWDTGTSCF